MTFLLLLMTIYYLFNILLCFIFDQCNIYLETSNCRSSFDHQINNISNQQYEDDQIKPMEIVRQNGFDPTKSGNQIDLISMAEKGKFLHQMIIINAKPFF